jgi:hypothetical protein
VRFKADASSLAPGRHPLRLLIPNVRTDFYKEK